MYRHLIFLPAVLLCSAGFAQEEGTRLSRDELLAFLPNAEVTSYSRAGSVRRWKNEPDGKFVASTDNKKYGNPMGNSSATASGTWQVNDDGKYCIKIDWKREAEDWCAAIIKTADGSFYLNRVDPARKIEFKK